MTVTACELPADALLLDCRAHGAFTDCYVVSVAGSVHASAFIEAFYTTWLFRLERALIAALAFTPSSDRDAWALATGRSETFAMWTVERRADHQILLADRSGRTRSWLMVQAQGGQGPAPTTLLYFGSAVIPRRDPRNGQARFGPLFGSLLGLHAAYSRALLRAASARLSRPGRVARAA